jgi:hypothetical protein
MKSVKRNTHKSEQIRLTEVKMGAAVTLSKKRGGLPTQCTVTVMTQTHVLMVYKSTFLLSERNNSEGPRRAK